MCLLGRRLFSAGSGGGGGAFEAVLDVSQKRQRRRWQLLSVGKSEEEGVARNSPGDNLCFWLAGGKGRRKGKLSLPRILKVPYAAE